VYDIVVLYWHEWLYLNKQSSLSTTTTKNRIIGIGKSGLAASLMKSLS